MHFDLLIRGTNKYWDSQQMVSFTTRPKCIKSRKEVSMCKVTCRACGRPFTVVGIVRRGESCFCSVRCLQDNLGTREETQNAISIEFHPKAPEPTFATAAVFQHPQRVGMLCH